MKNLLIKLLMILPCGPLAAQSAWASPDLIGRWETGCVKAENVTQNLSIPFVTLYTKAELEYAEDGVMNFQSEFFSSSSCDYALLTVVFSSSYEVFFVENGYNQIDMTVNSYFWTLPKGRVVEDFFELVGNVVGLCGIKNWEAGTERDVLGKTCAGIQVPEAGAVMGNIFAITSHVGEPDTLNTGRLDQDASSRPTELDTITYYRVEE